MAVPHWHEGAITYGKPETAGIVHIYGNIATLQVLQ
jgi:hypothetical protein